MTRTRRQTLVALLLPVLLLLAACGGGPAEPGDGPLAWRDLDLVVPDGWTVLDQRADLLLIANEDIRVDDIDAEPTPVEDPDAVDVVAVQFLADGSTGPDDWRALVEQEGGTLEADERTTVGDLPATSLTYEWASNDVPSRERVVFVPSRELYILLQPVPVQGQVTGPQVYLDHVDEFDAVIDSIEFGRPVDEG